MTVLINRIEQSYAPNTYTITRTVPAGATVMRLKVNMTDPQNWPAGRVADVRLIGPNGPSGGFSVDGGISLDRQGVPLTVRSAEFSQSNAQGPTPFPVGDYDLVFDTLQTAVSAVSVDRF